MLEAGKPYDVHGLRIYGAGKTASSTIETHNQIMYIHDWEDIHIFLADGDKSAGTSVNEGILTRVKIPIGTPYILGDQVMSQQVLDKVYILSDRKDLSEGMIRFLEKSMRFAKELVFSEKRDRFEAMIGAHLYDDYSISYEEGRRIVHKRRDGLSRVEISDLGIKGLMQKFFSD